MYLLDASAITFGLKRHRSRAFKAYVGQLVLDLTKFELGNTVWKEHTVLRKTDEATARQSLEDVRTILGFMNEYAVSEADLPGIMDDAITHRLSFYDASYLYISGKRKVTLVSEDGKLRRVAGERGIRNTSIEEMIKGVVEE